MRKISAVFVNKSRSDQRCHCGVTPQFDVSTQTSDGFPDMWFFLPCGHAVFSVAQLTEEEIALALLMEP